MCNGRNCIGDGTRFEGPDGHFDGSSIDGDRHFPTAGVAARMNVTRVDGQTDARRLQARLLPRPRLQEQPIARRLRRRGQRLPLLGGEMRVGQGFGIATGTTNSRSTPTGAPGHSAIQREMPAVADVEVQAACLAGETSACRMRPTTSGTFRGRFRARRRAAGAARVDRPGNATGPGRSETRRRGSSLAACSPSIDTSRRSGRDRPATGRCPPGSRAQARPRRPNRPCSPASPSPNSFDAIQHRQFQERLRAAAVIHAILGDDALHLVVVPAAGVQVALQPREVAARDLDAQPVSGATR